MPTVKERIVEQHGSINKFIDSVADKMTVSRTHMYKLIQNKNVNPTIDTLIELSELTNIPMEEIMNEYRNRHRDRQPQGEQSD